VSTKKIVLIPGDGIGPEIAEATKRVFEASGANIDWVVRDAGVSALEKQNELLPEGTLDAIREYKIALKGPCMTPIGGGFSSVNVRLRKVLDLYAAVRPIRNIKGVKKHTKETDKYTKGVCIFMISHNSFFPWYQGQGS